MWRPLVRFVSSSPFPSLSLLHNPQTNMKPCHVASPFCWTHALRYLGNLTLFILKRGNQQILPKKSGTLNCLLKERAYKWVTLCDLAISGNEWPFPPLTLLTFSTAISSFFSLNNDKRINLYKSSPELSSAHSLIDQWLQSKW